MKFSCEKAVLQEAALTASRAVSSKTTIGVLEGLLVSAGFSVSLCGYDLKTGIKCTVPAEVEQEGLVVLNARLLCDILRKLPDEIIYFSVDDNFVATLRCGLSEFTLLGLSPEEFPELPDVDRSRALSLPRKTLKSMIAQTIFAVSDNETKPIHTGSMFEIEDGQLQIISVDGFRLAVRTEKIEDLKGATKSSFVVPGSALREIERILDDTEEPVLLYPDRKFILFDIGGVILITRLLEGEFLNYRKALPEDLAVTYVAEIGNLLDSVERVSLIISERLKNPIRCLFEDELVRLSCVTSLGKAYDECRLQGRSLSAIEIGFNSRYLLDALRACPDEQAVIGLKSGLSPCVIRPVEGDAFLYLVLPVRLKAGE